MNKQRDFDISMEVDGQQYTYAPKPDITPFELAHLTQMFLVALINKNIDAKWFIEQHSLQRHFTVKK